MRSSEITEIVECLPRGETPFVYYRDRYAVVLLGYLARSHQQQPRALQAPPR